MPRQKKAHRHEVVYLPCPATVPLELLRAIYTRLSDDDPDSVSPEHQQERAQSYAESKGYVVTAVYRDWRTGTDPDRLALRRLIEDAHAGRHGGVIVYDHTRFHRGVRGAYPVDRLHHELPDYQFEATVGGYDIAQVGIWSGISGMELETTRRRSMDQRRVRARNGELMAGNLPYWLDRDPQSRQAVVNPERVGHVLHAIDLYAAGEPMTSVVRYMSEHAPARPRRINHERRPEMSSEREEVVAQDQRRNSMWSSTRMRELFRNPALWGDLPYARNLVVKEQRNGQPVVVGRKSNPKAVPVKVPPLIHRTDLERTECQLGGGCERDRYRTGDTLDQLIRGRNKREGGRPWGMEHPLRRRVVCPCGWRMAFRVLRRGEREYLYVACNKQTQLGRAVVDPNASVCGLGQQPVRVLWPMVQALFVQAVQQPDRLIAEAQAQILAEAAAEARSVAKEAQVMERLTEELNDLDAAENRLYKRLDSGLISEAVYRTQTAEIASQRGQLEESKRQLLSRRLIVQKAEGATISLREGLRRAAELRFDDLSLEQWSELLGALVQDVVLDTSGMPTLRWRRAA